ncbi:hypothetical protein HD806DRAFT_550577 [Xylariaceae sp. AK1471]|nr:hypothetical protein HD806DRAFT_550577 [Xylariaceae sp. AK1471]
MASPGGAQAPASRAPASPAQVAPAPAPESNTNLPKKTGGRVVPTVLKGYKLMLLVVQWILYLFFLPFSLAWDIFGQKVVAVLVAVVIVSGIVGKTALFGLASELLPPDTTHFTFNFPNAVILATQKTDTATEIRVLIEEPLTSKQDIKYLVVSHDVQTLGTPERFYSTTDSIELPVLPGGNWNCAEINRSPDGKKALVTKTSCAHLAGVEEIWHPLQIEYLTLKIHPMETSNERVQLVSHPFLDTPNNLAAMKFASFEDSIVSIEHETRVYKALEGSDAAPKFLGHVAENGRVIGFLMEYIEGARRVSSDEGFYDLALDLCGSALKTLHDQGVAHRDAHPGNCLIRKTGKAVWLDFERSSIPGKKISSVGPEGFVSETPEFKADFNLLRARVQT